MRASEEAPQNGAADIGAAAFLYKRPFDLCLTLLALPIILPACLLIAALIRLSGPGPIVLRLRCHGRNGVDFAQYRFRIIHADAADRMPVAGSGPRDRDPRLTPIGYWLVRTGLNRLPQIINVLKGEMSLVGPRPVSLAGEWPSHLAAGRLLQLRPGIVTPESLMSDQAPASERERHALDLAYAANPALRTDTKILFAAFARLIGQRSA